ncbi:MAG: hypothetical protein ABI199_04335 [Bacteroidia bacterium]
MTRKKLFFTSLFLISAITISTFLSSCSTQSRHQSQVKYMDSLATQLDQAALNLKKVDTVVIRKNFNTLLKNLSLIQKNYKDTMDSPTAIFLSGYRETGRAFEIFLGRDTLLQNQISKSIKQLKSLEHDVKNNLIDENKVQSYCANECSEAAELLEASSVSIAIINEKLPMFDIQNPKVEELVKKYSSSGDSKK